MSRWSVVYLILIIIFLVNVNCKDFCGKRTHYTEPQGIIIIDDEGPEFRNCTWSIRTPESSVVYIKIEQLQLGSNINMIDRETNCLFIKSIDSKKEFLSLCTDMINFNILSIPSNDLLIELEISSESFVELTYTSYIVNCTYNGLRCATSRNLPRQPDDHCVGGVLTCDTFCRPQAAACGDVCYEIFLQRCDGVLNCPNAEDEVGCNPTLCPNKIQCANDTDCVEPKQICDKTKDCKNGMDESFCPQAYCEGRGGSCYIEKRMAYEFGKDDNIYIVVVVMGVLAIFFLCMLFRYLASRQSLRALLNRPLDIPLPPFRGPGEGTSALEVHPFTDDDFKPGGEIYEGFTQNINKIKSRRKNILEIEEGGITFVKPPPGQEVLNKYFPGIKPVLSEELAALATIKISREMCHGLRKTKSEERPMTKLLFVDNVDNDVSDDSDTEEGPSDYWRKEFGRNAHPKSDTDYIKRKRVEITIV